MLRDRIKSIGLPVLRSTIPPYARLEARYNSATERNNTLDDALQGAHRTLSHTEHSLAKAQTSLERTEKILAESLLGASRAEAVIAELRLEAAQNSVAHRAREDALQSRIDELEKAAAIPRIRIKRGERIGTIDPTWFDEFPFEQNDELTVVPQEAAAALPTTWGDVNIGISEGVSIRVPAVWKIAEFRGFSLPNHLVTLTGAGPETLDPIGKDHIRNYKQYVGIDPDMTVIDLGCGIGRDAFQMMDLLGPSGKYIGVDVTLDSIRWCQRNITPRYENFTFFHFDAFSELYNPHGSKASMDFRLPAEDATVDRIVLASVFTHLLEDEVLHYMREFRRVLKPGGLVYASFFLYSAEALAAAAKRGNTSWLATFSDELSHGVYGNDPAYPRGAVAFTDEAMQRLIKSSGLRLMRSYLKGWWSGLHEEAEDGQDVAILGI